MTVRPLTIPGAWEITPRLHPDDRGLFYEWFKDSEFQSITHRRLDLLQVNCSVSAAGVLRGLHFAQVPPGQAKYVTCLRGSVFDVVVDIRVGSPTYGRWDSVVLDERDRKTVYVAEGLGHGFLALQDDSMVVYLCSAEYNPEREHTICAIDPALGIDWPTAGGGINMSDRDRDASSLDQVRAAGLLPTWDETRGYIEGLRHR